LATCRICSGEVNKVLDLGSQPIANSLLASDTNSEVIYPLNFYWCPSCQFGQVNDLPNTEIFTDDYPYYSSVNASYVKQCADWAHNYAAKYEPKRVLEIGSNDGYMLQNFKDVYHIGYEPSVGPANKAKEKGLNISSTFFPSYGVAPKVDLVIANNVLAHTPDLHGMVEGISKSLNDDGQAIVEFPPVGKVIRNGFYDTIYHEHYSYFSIHAIAKLFQKHGLYYKFHDPIASHGGSIRAYFTKEIVDPWVGAPYDATINSAIETFSYHVHNSKFRELDRIIKLYDSSKKMALFGAAAKGKTFLNYLGIKNDIFQFCVDETPAKQGKYLPGSRIPIVDIEELKRQQPDILFILPWNFKDEIIEKTKFIEDWEGEHVWKD
jgi:hypothetical protein